MNVYDFDNTILRGDSTALFFGWCLAHYPCMWTDLPVQMLNGLLFVLKLREKQVFKQRMLGFVRFIDDMPKAIERFWDAKENRIKAWYKNNAKEDDVVISASPEFLIRPICDRLGIKVAMGSPVDMHTGHFHGLNCHGEEKVRRYLALYPDTPIECFYSDSYSDTPLARISKKAYLVTGDKLSEWKHF